MDNLGAVDSISKHPLHQRRHEELPHADTQEHENGDEGSDFLDQAGLDQELAAVQDQAGPDAEEVGRHWAGDMREFLVGLLMGGEQGDVLGNCEEGDLVEHVVVVPVQLRMVVGLLRGRVKVRLAY